MGTRKEGSGGGAVTGRLELHVRCIKGEDSVRLYLGLLDGAMINLNRCEAVVCYAPRHNWYNSKPHGLLGGVFVTSIASVFYISVRVGHVGHGSIATVCFGGVCSDDCGCCCLSQITDSIRSASYTLFVKYEVFVYFCF